MEGLLLKHSHSTMYLLKQSHWEKVAYKDNDSHSTMYLLKLIRVSMTKILSKFTFHHVSIKTNTEWINKVADQMDSHSTMYLLKPTL